MLRFTLLSLSLLSLTTIAAAADPTVVADDLDNPTGVVIQKGTGHLLVAERRGVVRYTTNGKHRSEEITGYPTDIYGKGPKYNIGPLGLAWLGDQLVVGGGARVDGEELAHVYKVGTEFAKTAASEGSAGATLGPIGPCEESPKGEGNFYGVAVAAHSIFITSNGDDTKGWILRSVVENGKPGPLKPFIATKPQLNVDAPVAITVNSGGDLVVGQMGEVSAPPNDSLLAVFDPQTGKLKSQCATGLHDIAGLAYGPKGLYAVDYAWAKPEDGGLFHLTVSGDKCEARKVCSLDKPTALTFDAHGDCYITVLGTAAEGAAKLPGKIVKVAAGDL